MIAILFCVSGYAANPFLDTPDDKPVSAKFRGTEWSDDIGEQDIPLTARVVTTRVWQNAVGRDFQTRIYGSKIAR